MALGKPVITNKCVGTEDYIVNGVTGLLLDKRTVNSFKDAIISMVENKKLREKIQQNAIKEIKEKHTFRTYVDTILDQAYRLGK
jgi:glycosyltransferase involved in cell wall biosynthesis